MLKNLRLLREDAGISQKQLADIVGVSQQSINKYENHNVEPDLETLTRFARYFSTSVDYLIGYTTEKLPYHSADALPLSREEYTLLEKFKTLSEKQKESILTVMDLYNKPL